MSSFVSMIPRYNPNASASKNLQRKDTRSVHEKISKKIYEKIFLQLHWYELKEARLVCKKWNSMIFPIILQKSCLVFTGENEKISEISEEFTKFFHVSPRLEFRLKLKWALYKKGASTVTIPFYVIPWSHLRIRKASFYELFEWMRAPHLVNVTCLEFQNVAICPQKLYDLVRQFLSLREFRDVSFNFICPYEKRVLFDTENYSEETIGKVKNVWKEKSRINETESVEDPVFQSLLHVEVKRSQLEDITLNLRLLQLLQCDQLLSLKLFAVDTFISSDFVDKYTRAKDVKISLYKALGVVLKNNFQTLTTLKLSFRHTSMENWFDLFSFHFEDELGNMYKPEMAQFFSYLNHFQWKSFNLHSLTDLSLEFENKRNITEQEISDFTLFLRSLSKLQRLDMSHFFVSNENFPKLFTNLAAIRGATPEGCQCDFKILYRDSTLDISSKIHHLFGDSLRAISVLSEPINQTNDSDNDTIYGVEDLIYDKVEYLWLADNIPGRLDQPRLRIREFVDRFPNLSTLIIRDLLHDSQPSCPNIKRWNVIDDYGMQLILKTLERLKHLSFSGNLVYLTDVGITGIKMSALNRISYTNDYSISPKDINGVSFSSLKDLQHCSLEFLGSKVTDISLNCGFNNLKKLRTLALGGIIQMSEEIVRLVQVRLSGTTLILKTFS